MPEATPAYPVDIDRRVFVEMDDGVLIGLTVYRPDSRDDGPFPTIVESLPYRKDDAFYSTDWGTYTYLAQRGFAGVRIDIRGTGASTARTGGSASDSGIHRNGTRHALPPSPGCASFLSATCARASSRHWPPWR